MLDIDGGRGNGIELSGRGRTDGVPGQVADAAWTAETEFIWTAGEQLFFADKNFKNEPKRCKSCKAKRASRPARAARQVGRERVETTTNCSACGKETTVPFRPTQGRPVFCRECFQSAEVRGGGRHLVRARRRRSEGHAPAWPFFVSENPVARRSDPGHVTSAERWSRSARRRVNPHGIAASVFCRHDADRFIASASVVAAVVSAACGAQAARRRVRARRRQRR